MKYFQYYNEGKKAGETFYHGSGFRESNPYERDSQEWRDWEEGFEDAE